MDLNNLLKDPSNLEKKVFLVKLPTQVYEQICYNQDRLKNGQICDQTAIGEIWMPAAKKVETELQGMEVEVNETSFNSGEEVMYVKQHPEIMFYDMNGNTKPENSLKVEYQDAEMKFNDDNQTSGIIGEALSKDNSCRFKVQSLINYRL